MLTSIRKYTSTWIAPLFMGLLTLSFAVWGISDIFKGGVGDSVAWVGGDKILTNDYTQAYQRQRNLISQQAGRPLTTDQLRAIGLPDQVLQQLLSNAALDHQARDLGLGVSQNALKNEILNDQTFFGQSGKFDPGVFTQLLQGAQLTEAGYLAQRRLDEMRSQIATAVAGGGGMSDTLKKAIDQYDKEERSIRYIVLPTSAAGDVGQPTDQDLATYFDQNKSQWRAPEYRSLVVLKVEPADIAKPDEVSDADAKAFFEQNKAQYTVPEKRDVWQVLFKTKDEADAASTNLKAGTSFEDLLKQLNISQDDVHLGVITKNSIADKTVADAAFALKSGENSEVIAGRFGSVILHVGDVSAGIDTPFEAVSDLVKQKIATDRAQAKVSDMQDQIEDLRAGGATLVEAAEKTGLKAVTIDAVDRDGKGPDGMDAGVPGGAQLLAAAFASDVGIQNDPQPFGDRGAIWYDVTKIDLAHDRTLDEVKDKVAAAWHDNKVQEKLKARANEIAEKIRGGGDMAALATEAGATVTEAPSITRRENPIDQLTAEVIRGAFTGKEGSVTTAPSTDGSIAVIKVDKVTVPEFKPDDQVVAQNYDQVSGQMRQELLDSYQNQLQQILGTRVDQQAIQTALGATGS